MAYCSQGDICTSGLHELIRFFGFFYCLGEHSYPNDILEGPLQSWIKCKSLLLVLDLKIAIFLWDVFDLGDLHFFWMEIEHFSHVVAMFSLELQLALRAILTCRRVVCWFSVPITIPNGSCQFKCHLWSIISWYNCSKMWNYVYMIGFLMASKCFTTIEQWPMINHQVDVGCAGLHWQIFNFFKSW